MKGGKREGAGRPQGVPNKTTTEIREAFQMLVESKLPDMQNWITIVGEKDPARALDVMIRLGGFIIPKLQRVEVKGELTVEQLLMLTPEQRRTRILELQQQIKGTT